MPYQYTRISKAACFYSYLLKMFSSYFSVLPHCQKMSIFWQCGKTQDKCQKHIRCQLNLKSLFWPDGVRHLWSIMKASSGDNWKGRPPLRSCSNVLSIAFNTERSDVKRFLLTSYCLSSSQTWVIFWPNRNFYEKSISYPAGSLKIRS